MKDEKRKLYDKVITEMIKDDKRCIYCKDIIYYYDSNIKYKKSGKIDICGKSSKTSKNILDNMYYLCVCEDCLTKKYPEYQKLNKSRVFNRICDITNYAFNIPNNVAEEWKKQNYSITEKTLITKYGEKNGTIRWNKYILKQSESNKFEYKKEKHGWTENEFNTFNKNRSITLENLINKHGEDDGIKIWDNYILKQRITKSKEYVIGKYGEAYWDELCLKKSRCLKNSIERLGIDEGIKKYINNFNNITVYPPSKNSQKFFNNIDIILNKKYTTYYFDKNEEFCVFDNELGFIFLDYYIKDLNIIIEFNGDLWHANPNKFKENDIVPILKITAKEIWLKDEKRYNNLKQKHNFHIITVWENDLPSISNLLFEIEKIKKIGNE